MMKILVAYDGSPSADAALEDLHFAGLPDNVEAMVITVDDGLMFAGEVSCAETLARQAQRRLQSSFPSWFVRSTAKSGVPGVQILALADIFQPELIIVGGRVPVAGEHNIFLGSVSNKILTDAKTTVRIARGRLARKSIAEKIVIGFDGSNGSFTAIEAITRRTWPLNSEARLVLVTDSNVVSTVGRFAPQLSNLTMERNVIRQWAETLAETAIRSLRNTGLSVELQLSAGHPKLVLLEAAESWGAASIFVGPNRGGNSFDRYLLGSVSCTVAAQAHCTVEVVRPSAHTSRYAAGVDE